MVLHDIALHLMILHSLACHCIVSYGVAGYCIVGFGARAVSRKTPTYFICTFPIFYGTFKCHESHTEKHLIEYYKPGMAKHSLCNHFYNHKYHHESIACLGVEIRLQIKKL